MKTRLPALLLPALLLPALLLPALLLAACPAEEDPGEHACDHIAEAGTAITAGADAASAPTLSVAEEPYTVTLVDGAEGFVTLDAGDDHAEALLFLGTADVATGLQDADGDDVALPAAAPNEFCAGDIPEHYELHLDGGEVLVLGPSAVETVWISLLSAEGHAHGE